ncbi:MAG TPA: tetratricopeptide repeat protein [Polyangiaceae bacterium]
MHSGLVCGLPDMSDATERGQPNDPQTPTPEPNQGFGQVAPLPRFDLSRNLAPLPRFDVSRRAEHWSRRVGRAVRDYFAENDPIFGNAFAPAMLVAALLYMRSPTTNCIFDEQEALLANPYVNGVGLGFFAAFRRDFWGLPSTRSIGSYRPLPNLIWRALWPLGNSPWLLHWVNVIIHAACAALLASFIVTVTKQRRLGWWMGLTYVSLALLTESVSGVVGLADVLGALFVLLALHALLLPIYVSAFAVFAAVLLGLFSKESGLVALPLTFASAFLLAPATHPRRSLGLLRALLALTGAVGALVVYTELRKRWFPVELPTQLAQPLEPHASLPERAMHAFLRWFRQPKLPADPMNNPLVNADFPHRVAGALRVYASGLGQLLLPLRLSGDYSFPAEPVPQRLVFPGSVIGALAMVLPPLVAVFGWPVVAYREWRMRRRFAERDASLGLAERDASLGLAERDASQGGVGRSEARVLVVPRLVLLGLLWVPVAYFPHSNIPTLLPTVRAERFWVIPAIGATLVLGALVNRWTTFQSGLSRKFTIGIVAVWFGIQMAQARLHAFDYTDDLSFWRATAKATPNSAKARLNHAVMLGARQRLPERLAEGAHAIELAPKWPMAHIYQGDTLCRMERPLEAWPHYVRGFELGPNESNLIALALQCLWDKKSIEPHRDELQSLAAKHPGSWLAYLAYDILDNGAEHNGVQPKYRPRGYNEGPKK